MAFICNEKISATFMQAINIKLLVGQKIKTGNRWNAEKKKRKITLVRSPNVTLNHSTCVQTAAASLPLAEAWP